MLDETDGVDDELPTLVAADGFTEPTGLRIQTMLSIQIDATHEMIPLPENPKLLRRLNEIDGLGREEHLGWTARPTAGHRAEGAAAVLHQFIMHSHLGGSPGLQIGVFGIGKPFDDPRTSAVWTSSAWIGCRFRRLIVEIIRRQTNSAAPIWIGSPDRCEHSRNWPKNRIRCLRASRNWLTRSSELRFPRTGWYGDNHQSNQ